MANRLLDSLSKDLSKLKAITANNIALRKLTSNPTSLIDKYRMLTGVKHSNVFPKLDKYELNKLSSIY